jgi:hypothetical protein
MISEQTAAHSASQALRVYPLSDTTVAGDLTNVQTTSWRQRVQGVAEHAATLTMALLGSLASGVRPSYFELEQRGPTHDRLGPGLSRESDSFWPLSEW